MECENYETKLNYFVRFGINKQFKRKKKLALQISQKPMKNGVKIVFTGANGKPKS